MYVYFIQGFREKDMMQLKIGSSKDPEHRLAILQTGSPVELRLLGKIRCKSAAHARSVEKLAHSLFHKQRRRGEWFKLSKPQLRAVQSLLERSASI